MIMSQGAYTAYQIAIYTWFCVGVGVVGFLAIRDMFKMFRKKDKKEDKTNTEA